MTCSHAKLKLNTTIMMIDGRMAYKTDGTCLNSCGKSATAITKSHRLGKHSLPEAQQHMEERIKVKLDEAQR